ncbi:MAG: hypothetical protein HUJ89_01055 [Bacteroidales bacterium]|nr:hypothetical protein [Bacteroidales bacterium]
MRKALYISFLLVLCLSSCKMPEGGRGNIYGYVRDSTSSLPVRYARVFYGDSCVLTDEEGRFGYSGVFEGIQSVRISKKGFLPSYVSTRVARNDSVRADAALIPITTAWAVGECDLGYCTILNTTDGGLMWVRQGSSINLAKAALRKVCPISEKVCWAVGDKDTIRNQFNIVKTEDGGKNWERIGGTINGTESVSLKSIASVDSKTAFAMASDTALVVSTTNGGAAWSVCHSNIAFERFTDILTLDGKKVFVAGISNDDGTFIQYSTDSGGDWTFAEIPVSTFSPINCLAVATDSLLYACGDAPIGILCSIDGGKNWKSVLSGSEDYKSIIMFDEESGWVSTGEKVYFTSDKFATVDEIAFVSDYPEYYIPSFAMTGIGAIGSYSAAIEGSSSGSILLTLDAGETWTESLLPYRIRINDLAFWGCR